MGDVMSVLIAFVVGIIIGFAAARGSLDLAPEAAQRHCRALGAEEWRIEDNGRIVCIQVERRDVQR